MDLVRGKATDRSLFHRGIHNENQGVARRVFYLFAKFVKNSRTAIETSFVAEILAQIGVSVNSLL